MTIEHQRHFVGKQLEPFTIVVFAVNVAESCRPSGLTHKIIIDFVFRSGAPGPELTKVIAARRLCANAVATRRTFAIRPTV